MRIVGIWLELPVWQQLLALAGFYATTGIFIHLLAFHSPTSELTRSFKGVVAPFFVSVVLIFGLLLGFIARDVWQRNTDAVQVVRGEGDALFALSHLSPDSDPGAAKLPNLIVAYAQSVVGDEWPQMREGKRAAATETAFTSLLSAIVDAPVSGSSGSAVQRARFDLVLKLHTLRETRLALAGDRTDEIKWTTLLILGLISQIAIAAVHLETPRPQIAALTIFSMAAVIGLGLVAIQERPFTPPLEVSPGPLLDVIRETPAR
jgi:Protein of unknown function (DUF4239)